ncbi:Riboflavin transporter RfnT [Ephemeroptericola cinctiostellae]|uniref:Riboflavin transporter RfnT n=1 Tax=Ephemeroptericola cinctiostellae TaxID=2268024 RepID=A0A345DDU4_9BURK|nr:MFS transporter [Ephemeroptericola cinctiostellae]AXF86532.1 Riboflavin transporter RfnT [Ephemeroptericola cinctiostellae]
MTTQQQRTMPRVVWGLSLGQALLITGNILLVSVSALIGKQLAPDAAWITLPVALQFLGLMGVTLPAAHLVRRVGRKKVFLIGNLTGVLGAAVAYWALLHMQFTWFCAGTFLLGMAIGVGQQYRFAAVENAGSGQQANAVSLVMAGGVLAAILGPNLAIWAKNDAAGQQYLTAFLILLGLYALTLVVVALLPIKTPSVSEQTGDVRSYVELFKQPLLSAAIVSGTIGYAVMVLIMTATPLAMMTANFEFSHSAHVIQWHVLGMFVPSFFTGKLIARYGERTIILIGCMLLLACQGVNQMGHSYMHFTTALIALGVGWNFTFIGATTLLTRTYRPAEKAKVQGINDFLIFSFSALASLCAGYWQNTLGWAVLNALMMPATLIAMVLLYRGFKLESKQVA